MPRASEVSKDGIEDKPSHTSPDILLCFTTTISVPRLLLRPQSLQNSEANQMAPFPSSLVLLSSPCPLHLSLVNFNSQSSSCVLSSDRTGSGLVRRAVDPLGLDRANKASTWKWRKGRAGAGSYIPSGKCGGGRSEWRGPAASPLRGNLLRYRAPPRVSGCSLVATAVGCSALF